MKRTIGIYVGSFNPFTIGHLNVLQKAQDVFDKVIVGQGWNPEKPRPNLVQSSGFERRLNGSEFYQYEGLTTDFIRQFKVPGTHVSLIRGTRSGHDYEQEITNLRVMEDISGEPIPIVFIPCDRNLEHVSSSMVRQLMALDPRLAERYLP